MCMCIYPRNLETNTINHQARELQTSVSSTMLIDTMHHVN